MIRLVWEGVRIAINKHAASRLKFVAEAEDASPCSGSRLPRPRDAGGGSAATSLPADPSQDCGRTGIRMSHALMCHTWHLLSCRKFNTKKKKKMKEVKKKKKKSKEIQRNSDIYWRDLQRENALSSAPLTRRGSETVMFNRMCFIASCLQSDLSDPTNHKLPYQRRISGLIWRCLKGPFRLISLFGCLFYIYIVKYSLWWYWKQRTPTPIKLWAHFAQSIWTVSNNKTGYVV